VGEPWREKGGQIKNKIKKAWMELQIEKPTWESHGE